MKYRYSLKNGKDLKNAKESDDIIKILEILKKCWQEIHENFPDEYDEIDLEDSLDDVDREFDNLLYFEDYGLTIENLIDNINHLITELNYYCKIGNIYVDTLEEEDYDSN